MFASVTVPATVPLPPWIDPLLASRSKSERSGSPNATLTPAHFSVDGDDKSLPSLDLHLIREPETTFFLRAMGEDWAQVGVHDGDLLVVDRATPATTGSLVVMTAADGSECLAQLDRDNHGRRMVRLADSDHPALPLSDSQSSAIRGVVRWVIHRAWPRREA